MSTRSLNRVELIGNLTRDTELRYTASGTPVASFTVATNRNYTDSTGTAVETAEFTPIVAWAKLAEICAQFLKKGTKVFIDGRLQTNSWQDKETGKTMKRTEVVATNMIVLSGGGTSSDYQEAPDSQEKPSESKVAEKSSDMGEKVDMNDIDLGSEFEEKKEDSSDEAKKDKKKEDSDETPF